MSIALAQVLLEHYGPDEDIEFPAGFQLNRVAWLLDPGEPQEYELRQEMEQGLRRLVLYPLASIAEQQRPGSMFIARLKMINNRLAWQHLRPDGQGGAVHFLDIGRDREIPVPEEGALEIRGNFDQLLIDGMTKPDWASIAQGRQPGGKEYFHLVTQGEEKKELAWCDPGEYPVRNREGEQITTFWLTKGFFAVTDEVEEIQTQGFSQPSWAENMGVDQYGLYADLVFKGVTQRFRWIQPGRFMMGSPEDEPERSDDETQHEVVLAESYWLADTACTQKLWTAVTGEHPSHFRGSERPVEQVSWYDIQGFLKRLNGEITDFEVDLPSESQWEYSCRAGIGTIKKLNYSYDINVIHQENSISELRKNNEFKGKEYDLMNSTKETYLEVNSMALTATYDQLFNSNIDMMLSGEYEQTVKNQAISVFSAKHGQQLIAKIVSLHRKGVHEKAWEEATSYLVTLLELNKPTLCNSYCQIAYAISSVPDSMKWQMQYFDLAMKSNRFDPIPLIGKAELLARMGRPDEAEQFFDKAFQI
ncbi:MAG: hypothetical protein D3925_09775, partial [Candidatus Electrothrix sp. AR5]|nr:hypothetical protein [Candidatus Electrothrix sp. AR5]